MKKFLLVLLCLFITSPAWGYVISSVMVEPPSSVSCGTVNFDTHKSQQQPQQLSITSIPCTSIVFTTWGGPVFIGTDSSVTSNSASIVVSDYTVGLRLNVNNVNKVWVIMDDANTMSYTGRLHFWVDKK